MIDWLISHPPARAFEGVSGRRISRSQQRGRVFVAVSYMYLTGGMQPPGCRRLRVWFLIYVWCSGFLFVSSEWRVHVSKLEVRPFIFFRWEAALCNIGVRAMSVCLPCFANMHACLRAGDASILPRMEFALCCADVV